MTSRSIVIAVCAAALLCGCEREARRFDAPGTKSQAAPAELRAGGHVQAAPVGDSPATNVQATPNPAEKNAFEVAQGKRLFGWYNCTGCHAHGGGGMGPALMDDKWTYGYQPADVYRSIVEGRPNGMPAFGGKIADSQVWQLVAYVRSMSGQLRIDIAPSRNDDLQASVPEARREKASPRTVGSPQ